jgi:tetratricopeptide (TPR) repeat protein
MLGVPREGASVAYTETFYPRLQLGWSELVAFYQDGMKYVRAPRVELYALEQDGEERYNLAAADAYQSTKQTLEHALDAFVERHGADGLDPDPAPVDREDLEALRALGYVTSSAPATGGDRLADPKDRIDVFNRLNDAVERFRAGEIEPALAAALGILRAEPALLEAHVLVGHAYRSQGRFRESAECFERVLELKPDSNFAMIDLLSALISLGEHGQVIERAHAFLRQFPTDPVLHEELAAAHFFRGELDEALASFQRSVEISASALALSKIGEIHARRGDLGGGESYVRRALAQDPRNRGSYYTLAQIEEARGNPDEALRLYQKELENDPRNYKASFNVAILLRKQGRLERAVHYCRKTIESNPAFNVPYFMIAEYYLEQGTDLPEAIDLCKRGIAVAPGERSALPGYQVLLRLLAKTGDWASHELYLARANELARDVEGQR